MLNLLEALARGLAWMAGLLLAFILVLATLSILGRETLGWSLPGDYEGVALATAAAVGLFMPLCQMHRGNIVVDFFTARAPRRLNAVLDRMAAGVLGLSFALLAWRAGVGGLESFQNGSTTMLLGFPEWPAYATMVLGFALTAVIGLVQLVAGFGRFERHAHGEVTA
jgi:TRAP-type C4-dicarboxylate transport system permease small subunit